jgi:hypothetical protein
MYPFREALTVSSICNKEFQKIFLKDEIVGIIPREGCRMGYRQSVEAPQRLAYIGQTEDNFINASNGVGHSFAWGTKFES